MIEAALHALEKCVASFLIVHYNEIVAVLYFAFLAFQLSPLVGSNEGPKLLI
jgi:hypothetical protein